MRELLATTPVMPILMLHDASSAGELAEALVAGGIMVFEVLMRTSAAPDAVRAMKRAAPQAHIGAGTLLTAKDVETAVAAGASFGVAPGLTAQLAAAVKTSSLPFLPGVASASEIMAAVEHGFRELKFFPAHGSAGITWLQSMAGVFPHVTFCPTGGIKQDDVAGYLALPNCKTVGGTWVAPAELIARRDWAGVTALAKTAMAMKEAA